MLHAWEPLRDHLHGGLASSLAFENIIVVSQSEAVVPFLSILLPMPPIQTGLTGLADLWGLVLNSFVEFHTSLNLVWHSPYARKQVADLLLIIAQVSMQNLQLIVVIRSHSLHPSDLKCALAAAGVRHG